MENETVKTWSSEAGEYRCNIISDIVNSIFHMSLLI